MKAVDVGMLIVFDFHPSDLSTIVPFEEVSASQRPAGWQISQAICRRTAQVRRHLPPDAAANVQAVSGAERHFAEEANGCEPGVLKHGPPARRLIGRTVRPVEEVRNRCVDAPDDAGIAGHGADQTACPPSARGGPLLATPAGWRRCSKTFERGNDIVLGNGKAGILDVADLDASPQFWARYGPGNGARPRCLLSRSGGQPALGIRPFLAQSPAAGPAGVVQGQGADVAGCAAPAAVTAEESFGSSFDRSFD